MKTFIRFIFLAVALWLFAGCKRSGELQSSSKENAVAKSIAARPSSTFSDFPVPTKPVVTPQLLEQGKSIYLQNCVACHGVKGDGKGDAAAFLLPKPRDFVQAHFRLRSTPPGCLPTDADLFRAVSLGMPGTPMPPWKVNLDNTQRWAVVEYLKTFSPRFTSTNEDRSAVVWLAWVR